MLFFLSTFLNIKSPIENIDAIKRAKANSSRLLQNPNPIPVTHITNPSPIPIFPPVALLKRISKSPNVNPPILLSNDMDEQKGIHMHKSTEHTITIHTFIFFAIRS